MSKPTGKSGVDTPDANPSGTTNPADEPQNVSASENPQETVETFGTAVPYAGNDATEEVDPIALEASFSDTPDATTNSNRDKASPSSRNPESGDAEDKVRPLEDLQTTERKLVLNDLFDSALPEGSGLSLTPPNPTAFWSSKPPARRSEPPPRHHAGLQKQKPPAAERSVDPLESIDFDESIDETIPLDLQKGPPPIDLIKRVPSASPPAPSLSVQPPPAAPPSSGEALPQDSKPTPDLAAREQDSRLEITEDSEDPGEAGVDVEIDLDESSQPGTELSADVQAEAQQPPVAPPGVAISDSVIDADTDLTVVASVTDPSVDPPVNPSVDPPVDPVADSGGGSPSAPPAELPMAPPAELPMAPPAELPVTPPTASTKTSPPPPPTAPSVGGEEVAKKRDSAITLESTPSVQKSSAGSAPPDSSSDISVGPSPAAPGGSVPPTILEAAAAPAPAKVQASLPSVVVANEEAGSTALTAEESSLKAARASKATMIIELPADFNQPGGPTPEMLADAAAGLAPVQPSPAEVIAKPPGASKNSMWIAAALMFGLAAILIGYRFMAPSTGTLVVTAQGPGGAPVAGVSISIQGLTCGTSPCIISRIQPGQHIVSVNGTGVEPNETAVLIEAGKEFVHNVLLRPLGTPMMQGGRAGSVHLAATDQQLTLFIDRNRIGELPQTVTGIAAGRHWLELKTEDGAEEVARWITVESGKRLEVSPKPEPSAFGSVTISLNSSSRGAAVTLDDAFLLDFPADVELEPGIIHRLSASKAGYRDFKTEIEVTAGQEAEIIEIDLRRGSSRRKSAKSSRARRKKKSRKKSKRPKPKEDPTLGRLTLRSTPPSNIILNGRPIGKTPKVGLSVPGDSLQTVVFVHPEKGRRRAQKYVKAGELQTVSIQF